MFKPNVHRAQLMVERLNLRKVSQGLALVLLELVLLWLLFNFCTQNFHLLANFSQ